MGQARTGDGAGLRIRIGYDCIRWEARGQGRPHPWPLCLAARPPPVNASPERLLVPAQTGGQPGSLELGCIGLSPTTPCRFILAHGTPLICPLGVSRSPNARTVCGWRPAQKLSFGLDLPRRTLPAISIRWQAGRRSSTRVSARSLAYSSVIPWSRFIYSAFCRRT